MKKEVKVNVLTDSLCTFCTEKDMTTDAVSLFFTNFEADTAVQFNYVAFSYRTASILEKT